MSYPPPQDPYRPDDPATGDPWTPPPGNPHYETGHASPPTASFPPVSGYGSPYGEPRTPPHGYPTDTGYGQPPYEQPGPPPPPPRPKRSNVPLVAVLLAVTLLLCAGAVTAGVQLFNRATEKAEETVGSLPTSTPDIEVPALPSELPTLPSDVPGIPGLGKEFTVDYEVTGDGPVQILYVEKQGETPKKLTNVDLPWTKSVTLDTVGVVSVVALRTDISEGSVSCSIKVDGEEVSTKTTSGRVASANCSKVVY